MSDGLTRADELPYRADIDGLRATAILSVLGFHTLHERVPGGFVGVDIFFVISGFLITGIILRGLARGTFSLGEFYARRIRRIFPALILVLLCVWALGWLKLFPDEFSALAKHVSAASAYLSNFLLYTESGYFDTAAELKPLLHLWSLGVEEQFYLIWPLLLLATWRWRRVQLLLLLGLACGSFTLNVMRVGAHPVSTFYLPQTRLWELALGGILAYVQLRPGQLPAAPRLRTLASAAGLALLLLSIGTLDARRPFPGWWALGPTLGTALLIWAGERTFINRKLLAHPALVFIGVVSYPLYLWHWPLLSLTRILEGPRITTAAELGAVALAFPLSILTYYCVERPVRALRPAGRIALPLFAALAAIGLVSLVTFQRQLAPLAAHAGFQPILRAAAEQNVASFPGPHLRVLSTRWGEFLTQGAGPPRVLFFGDSNIEQYYFRVDALLQRDPQRTRSVVFASSGGCPPLPQVHEPRHPGCEGLVTRTRGYAGDAAIDTVVIGAAWLRYFPSQVDPASPDRYYYQDGAFSGPLAPGSEGTRRALSAFEAMIGQLRSAGKRVYIVLQIPGGDAVDPRTMLRRELLQLRLRLEAAPLSRALVSSAAAGIDAKLAAIALHTGALVLDPLATLCNETSCPTLTPAGEPIYRDDTHLRPAYVREHILFLDSILVEDALPAPPRLQLLVQPASGARRTRAEDH